MMPGGLVLHNRRAVALHRVEDDDRGLTLGLGGQRQRGVDGLDVVARNGQHVPTEGGPALLLRILLHDVLGAAADLQAVAVHERAQVIELVVAAAHGALPDRALGKLAVAHDGVDAVVAAIHLAGKRHPDGHGQAVTQRARVHLDALELVVGVADVGAAELGEAGLDVVEVQIALVAEHRVVGLHGVALGEHEAIAVGIVDGLGRNVEVIGIEGHEGVDDRHVAADVPAGASHDDIDAIAAKVPTQGFKLFDSCHFYSPRR